MATSIRVSSITESEPLHPVSLSPTRRVAMQIWRKEKVALAALAFIVVSALAAPALPLANPLDIIKGAQFSPPSAAHPFGTDEFGRDILSRTIYAGRISLLTGVLAVAVAMATGVPLGMVAGYAGRWPDTVIMRLMDVLLAFPAILLAMAVVAILGPGSFNATIAVAVVSTPTFARLARAAMLVQKEQVYVEATRSIGATPAYLIFRTILPNALPPIIVQVAIAMGFAILLEAALSFLGLGTQPPTPSWGTMLQVARTHLRRAWWYGFFPGLFVTVLILALNSLSDRLRDALDPSRQRV